MKPAQTSPTALARAGLWMQRHAAVIRRIQWAVVVVYVFLIVVPVVLPLPGDSARILNNLTVFAQFVFWGIWWPFVLLSMVLMGRIWCGVLCPEGALTEFASRHGLGKAIPHWMRWSGWPFVAFTLTTLYGQMVSVYQYPQAVMVVLGGSTVAAIAIGLVYGREKRVWCRHLCPVNGVFGLLSRLAPFRYKVDEAAWRRSYTQGEHGHRVVAVNCAPLVPLRTMQGGAECHMCGRCAGHREAVALDWRSPSDEIVRVGEARVNVWDTVLVLYGLMGVAIGGFHWSASPWYVEIKQAIATWLIDRDIMWPLADNAPWFVFTHYPEHNDVFTWLDGSLVIAYMVGTGLLYGTALLAALAIGTRAMGRWRVARLHHLVQALIPTAGCGVFLGLSATTLSILRPEGIWLGWAPVLRLALLASTNLWSLWLGWQICGRHASGIRRAAGTASVALALVIADSAWWLMFWHWA